MGLAIRYDLWSEYGDTPFWLSLSLEKIKSKWIRPDKFKKECEDVANKNNLKCIIKKDGIHIPIYPKLNKVKDEVIDDISMKIIRIIGELEEVRNK